MAAATKAEPSERIRLARLLVLLESRARCHGLSSEARRFANDAAAGVSRRLGKASPLVSLSDEELEMHASPLEAQFAARVGVAT